MPSETHVPTAPFTTVAGGEPRVAAAPQPSPPRPGAHPKGPRRQRELGLLIMVAVMVAAAVALARSGMFTAGSDVGYWLGAAGGTGMLLLFSYPLRKRWRALGHVGTTRFWFALHMALGVAGPLLIIVHSTLTFGSINATVAFASMALVALSGIVGRFLYRRIHHGLYGRRATLAELRAQAGLDSAAVHSKLAFAPQVEARLAEFARRAEATSGDGLGHPLRFFLLGFVAASTRRACNAEVRRALEQRAAHEGWSDEQLLRRTRKRRALVVRHIRAVQQVAQFGVFERLFSWWHVLHVPLVYMMVLSAIAHVVAVHMY